MKPSTSNLRLDKLLLESEETLVKTIGTLHILEAEA